jgi:beta-glucosidase/6-phospho-beta-glucosidase/beta-galactosidase
MLIVFCRLLCRGSDIAPFQSESCLKKIHTRKSKHEHFYTTSDKQQTIWLQKINLPGFEFGAQTDGRYTAGTNPAMPPPESQIAHFLSQNVNFFRVPVAWEYLQPEMNGKLNEVNLKAYQTFIEKITIHGAYVAIDLHAVSVWFSDLLVGPPSTDAPSPIPL